MALLAEAATLADVPAVADNGVCAEVGNVGGGGVCSGRRGVDGGGGGTAARGAATFAHELFGSNGTGCVAVVATVTPPLVVGRGVATPRAWLGVARAPRRRGTADLVGTSTEGAGCAAFAAAPLPMDPLVELTPPLPRARAPTAVQPSSAVKASSLAGTCLAVAPLLLASCTAAAAGFSPGGAAAGVAASVAAAATRLLLVAASSARLSSAVSSATPSSAPSSSSSDTTCAARPLNAVTASAFSDVRALLAGAGLPFLPPLLVDLVAATASLVAVTAAIASASCRRRSCCSASSRTSSEARCAEYLAASRFARLRQS